MTYLNHVSWIDVHGNHHRLAAEDYYINSKCITPVLFVEAPESLVYYASSLHLKLIDGKYMPHHDSEPAFIAYDNEEYTKYSFFNEGVSCTIEDLACDNVMKTYLKLKHEQVPSFNNMITYI
jgi:hypothetical protein